MLPTFDFFGNIPRIKFIQDILERRDVNPSALLGINTVIDCDITDMVLWEKHICIIPLENI